MSNKPKIKLISCKCGCGTLIKSRNRNGLINYVWGHHWRGKKRINENRNQNGNKNNNWKGGVIINEEGYRHIRFLNHPRASKKGSYVPEHVLIMEKYLGRYLTLKEVVHHKNEIKDDNRIGNLQLMLTSEHSILHRQKELAMNKPLFGRKK